MSLKAGLTCYMMLKQTLLILTQYLIALYRREMSFCRFPFTENKRMKNRALIVSVGNFYPDADLSKRNSVKRDSRRLHKILTKLGFSVEIKIDTEAEEIYEAFKAESEKTVKDCFVGIISTHGEEGVVFGADGCAVKLAEIYSYFGGPSMADKSKLFLIQEQFLKNKLVTFMFLHKSLSFSKH